MSAYDEGYDAGTDGCDASDNPYNSEDENFDFWDEGYFNATKDNGDCDERDFEG